MARQPRSLLRWSYLLSLPLVALTPSLAHSAEDAAAPPTTAPTTPVTPTTPVVQGAPTGNAPNPNAPLSPLEQSADDFWHFAMIANYERANAEAAKVLASDPTEVLKAFEVVAAARSRGNLQLDAYEFVVGLQRVEALRENALKLTEAIVKGQFARRTDTKYIEENIKRLGGNMRAFDNAVARLRQSGEHAVPQMIMTLRDPNQRPMHQPVQQALVQMGRDALNPLVAATESRDEAVLLPVVSALGRIGNPSVLPYLARVSQNKDTPGAVRTIVNSYLNQWGVRGTPNTAQLFYELAENFYYDKVTSITSGHPESTIWFWDEAQGLIPKRIPDAIFNECMAMRSAEYVLKYDANRGDAVSLWAAANYKRELDLAGGADPTHEGSAPHFWGSAAGIKYLTPVLARALRDRQSGVAAKALDSLATIVGASTLFNADDLRPMGDALRYGDRVVRFKAGFTIAQALPQKPFAGQEAVVPALAEALAQTGKPGAIVFAPDATLNALKDEVAKAGAGYNVVAASTPEAVIAAAGGLASVDVLLIDARGMDDGRVRQMLNLADTDVRLQRSARVAIAAPIALRATLTDAPAADAAAIGPAIEKARAQAGALALSPEDATKYALQAAELLGKLAISRGQVLDLGPAQQTLLAALDDARPEIAKASANVLGYLNGAPVQATLVTKALLEATAEELRVAFFKALATNAKMYGPQLEPPQVEALRKAVEEEKNANVRAAAAEAHGAMNLPADHVKQLIVNQSKT